MPDIVLLQNLVAFFLIVAIGAFLIIVNPNKCIISEDYNFQVACEEFEQQILESEHPDFDLIRRNIEAFKVEHEFKVSKDVLSKYVNRLYQALDEIEHGISYS